MNKSKTIVFFLLSFFAFTAFAQLSKPPIVFIDTCPKPLVIQVPKTAGGSYTKKTKNGEKKIELFPPVISQALPPAAFFTNFNTQQGLALSAIASGYRDKNGNLWFGTYGGGVSRYDGKTFTNFTTTHGLGNNTVLCITEDKRGNIWFATYGGGASCYDGVSFRSLTTVQGMANNNVIHIAEDKVGNIWFATDEGGVSRFDANRVNYPCCKNTCKHDLRIQ